MSGDDDRFTVTGNVTMHIEDADMLRRCRKAFMTARDFRDLYEQRWPAPPQILTDAVKEFGEERALELDRQAHRRSRTASDSYEEQLEMLVLSERTKRAMEAANRQRDPFAPPFAFSLRHWPRRGL